MKIKVKESNIIWPSKETPKEHLWVSNLDYLLAWTQVPLVYFYNKPNGYCSNFFEARVLKESLSNVLVPFYPIAGRLGRDKNGRIEIQCNAEGVLYLEARTDSTIDDLGDFTPSLEIRQLVPTVDYSSHISSYPLLLIQVTFFKCGGISLGIGWHHILGDGTSSLHFLNSWSNVARGLLIGTTPSIDRTLLRARVPPSPAFHHMEYDPPPSMNNPNQIPESQSGPKTNSTLTLNITLDQLNTQKAKAGKIESTTTNYSTYEILVAHIWRCACKARTLADDQPTRLNIGVSGRFRLRPSLPEGYFGNVIFPIRPIALSGDLGTESLTFTVKRIHNAIKAMDNDYLRSAIDYLEEHPNLEALVPRQGNQIYGCPNLNVVNWMQLPLYDADFGWGRPIYTGIASVYMEGLSVMLPSSRNDGSLSLVICLEANHLQLFKELFYVDMEEDLPPRESVYKIRSQI